MGLCKPLRFLFFCCAKGSTSASHLMEGASDAGKSHSRVLELQIVPLTGQCFILDLAGNCLLHSSTVSLLLLHFMTSARNLMGLSSTVTLESEMGLMQDKPCKYGRNKPMLWGGVCEGGDRWTKMQVLRGSDLTEVQVCSQDKINGGVNNPSCPPWMWILCNAKRPGGNNGRCYFYLP